MQHDGRPDDAVVPFVEIAVLRRAEVGQDENRLKFGVVFVCKLLDGVCGDARRVDVLDR